MPVVVFFNEPDAGNMVATVGGANNDARAAADATPDLGFAPSTDAVVADASEVTAAAPVAVGG